MIGMVNNPHNLSDGLDRPILCDDKIFQYGDAIAIVCADTEAHARAAAAKVKVELRELPAYMSAPAAMAPDAIEIHPGTPNVYLHDEEHQGAGHEADHGRAPLMWSKTSSTPRGSPICPSNPTWALPT